MTNFVSTAIVFVGQSMCALAQSFILSAPTKMAATWFGEKERGTANMIASICKCLCLHTRTHESASCVCMCVHVCVCVCVEYVSCVFCVYVANPLGIAVAGIVVPIVVKSPTGDEIPTLVRLL